jgi:hypothetical protein
LLIKLYVYLGAIWEKCRENAEFYLFIRTIMETKFKDLQNLYEVRKTVRFELKPSKTTEKKLIKKDKIFELPTNILFKNKI